MAGHLDMVFITSSGSMTQLQSDKVRPLAVAGPKRLSGLPEVPTFAEAGVKGMLAESWNGFLAPAKTPPSIVRKLHEAAVAAMAAPDVREKLEAQGAHVVANSPEEFRKEISAELKSWAQAFRELGIEKQ